MKGFRIPKLIAVLAAVMLAIGTAGCGDDESSNGTGSDVGISIDTETTATTTAEGDAETEKETATLDEEAQESLEKEIGAGGSPKIKGPTETVPGIGVIPKPTDEQKQQIAKCVEKAGGDPNKLAKCGQIVVK